MRNVILKALILLCINVFLNVPNIALANRDVIIDTRTSLTAMDLKMEQARERFKFIKNELQKLTTHPPETTAKSKKNLSENEAVNLHSDNFDRNISASSRDDKKLELNTVNNSKNFTVEFQYGINFPEDMKFRDYVVEYKIGHQFELELFKKFDDFKFGGSLGGKLFKADKFLMPWTIGQLALPANGKSYTLSADLFIGYEHYLSETLFLTSNIGFGTGWAWDNLILGSTNLYDSNSNFIFGTTNFGVGYAYPNNLRLSFFYQFDYFGNRDQFNSQYFNQIGFCFGLNY